MSRLRASEEKVREVRARDQEHEADGGLQDQIARRAEPTISSCIGSICSA